MSIVEIFLSILVLILLTMVFLLNKHSSSATKDPTIVEWLKTTQQQMQVLERSMAQSLQQSGQNVTDTLQKSYQSLNDRLDKSASIINELKNETGKFSEIGRSMQSLQSYLNSPKLRGNLGETILADLMTQILPRRSFATQYRFSNGDTVDAVIKTQAGLIPIDSKFPMENYVKFTTATTKLDEDTYKRVFLNDVRKHIKNISTKYIKENENTIDFALMYIPSESIYYEITANHDEINQFCQDCRVLAVSPSTFYAFLRTILASFEGQRIADEAKRILQGIRAIQKQTLLFGEKLQLVQKHLSNAFNNMNEVTTDYNQLKQKIDSTSSLSDQDEAMAIKDTNI